MICPACREGHHDECRGGGQRAATGTTERGADRLVDLRTWCYCQHRHPAPTEPPISSPAGE